jgi:sulfoxide reductase heme-binding subunit YedZ
VITGHLLSAPVIVGPSLLWYATRATGVVALVLLTGTVVLGVIGTARAASARWPRIVTAGLHRNLALTSAALVGVHIVTTVLDPFAPIGWIAAVIPFSSSYRPLWLSLGAIAFDLLLAVLITSMLRDRLSHRTWQAVHLLVYASWPIALWHGLGTGTDTPLAWVLAVDVACVTAVGWAVWWRLSLTSNPLSRGTGLAAVAVLPLLTLVFVITGPLQPGWSRRAGTPSALLGGRTRTSAGSAGTGTTGTGGQPGRLVNARFTGHLSVTAGPAASERTITITGRTVAAPRENLIIVLHGTPSGSGVALSGGDVRIGQPGTASGYDGPVVELRGQQLVAAVTGQSGQRRAQFILTISGSAVTGTVSLLAAAQE